MPFAWLACFSINSKTWNLNVLLHTAALNRRTICVKLKEQRRLLVLLLTETIIQKLFIIFIFAFWSVFPGFIWYWQAHLCCCRLFNISVVISTRLLIIPLEVLHSSSMVALSTLWQGVWNVSLHICVEQLFITLRWCQCLVTLIIFADYLVSQHEYLLWCE